MIIITYYGREKVVEEFEKFDKNIVNERSLQYKFVSSTFENGKTYIWFEDNGI